MVDKMAMLAEPRRKKKISLDPRGSNWTNDDNKFGQKLMEKMGWSKGKGLGAKLDGRMEPVKASLRTDNRGVGCSKSYADNWIAHQDDFNTLLANLSQDHGGGGNSSEEETVRVSSLEQKSRQSRGRVHYQKFTKGKDLSLKSSRDLDCVFGKRKSQSGSNTPLNQSEVNSDASDTEGVSSSGLKTVKSSDSIQSYFAKKMAEKKAKLNGDYAEEVSHLETFADNKIEDNMANRIEDTDEMMTDVLENEKEVKKSKKKSKKSKNAKDEEVDDKGIWFEAKQESIGDTDSVSRNVDGKPTDDSNNVENVESHDMENVGMDSIKKKKKKSKKIKKITVDEDIECDHFKTNSENIADESQVDLQDSSIQSDESKPKKRKKSKKSKNKDNLENEEIIEASDVFTNKGIKGKDSKLQDSDDLCDKEDINCDNTKPKKKSKKPKKTSEADMDISSSANDTHKTVCHKDNKDSENESRNLMKEGRKDKKVSSKKRKLENNDNEVQNTEESNTTKENDSEGGESDKKKKYCLDEFLKFDSATAFSGANLSQIKGYTGLNQKVVMNGLKKRYEKRLQ